MSPGSACSQTHRSTRAPSAPGPTPPIHPFLGAGRMVPAANDPPGMQETPRTLWTLRMGRAGLAEPLGRGGLGVAPGFGVVSGWFQGGFGVVSGCLVWLPGLPPLPRSERTHTSRAGYCRNEISTGRECNPRAN